jgi:hypothetical protein
LRSILDGCPKHCELDSNVTDGDGCPNDLHDGLVLVNEFEFDINGFSFECKD